MQGRDVRVKGLSPLLQAVLSRTPSPGPSSPGPPAITLPLSAQLPTPGEMGPGTHQSARIFLPFPLFRDCQVAGEVGGSPRRLSLPTAHLGLSPNSASRAGGRERARVHSRCGLGRSWASSQTRRPAGPRAGVSGLALPSLVPCFSQNLGLQI